MLFAFSQGGLYTTNNAAQNWKAAVEETVDATLNRTVSSGISGASYYTGTFGTIARNPVCDVASVVFALVCTIWAPIFCFSTNE